jgi:hypothetical protein
VTPDEQTARCISLLLRVLAQGDRSDVVILRAGKAPCLIGPSGTRPLAEVNISATAMRRFLTYLLPEHKRDVLAAVGETQHTLPARIDLPSDRFVIDAEVAHGGPIVAVRRVPVENYRPVDRVRRPSTPMRSKAPVYDDSLEVPTAEELWGDGAVVAARGRRPWL